MRLNGKPISPRARRVLAARGDVLEKISGSGPNGRIVAADVEKATGCSGEGRKRLSEMRYAVAQRTTESFSVPHFYLRADIDATELLAYRASRLSEIEQSD